ncbi:MAG: hypothetical protein HQM13_06630 [SAR324 cluster bacterium]|nr:hypothetical protein [SAR324 cluster bacterium]
MKSKIINILLLSALLTGCLSTATNEGLRRVKEKGDPLFVSDISLLSTNIAPVQIAWYNPGPRTIDEIRFSVSIFNQKGEKVHQTELISSGPHLPMDQIAEKSSVNRIWWFGDWYRPTMTCILVDQVDVRFEDGSAVLIDTREKLDQIISDGVAKSCRT